KNIGGAAVPRQARSLARCRRRPRPVSDKAREAAALESLSQCRATSRRHRISKERASELDRTGRRCRGEGRWRMTRKAETVISIAAQRMHELFPASSRGHATWDPKAKMMQKENGKLKPKYEWTPKPITVEAWQRHLDGERALVERNMSCYPMPII